MANLFNNGPPTGNSWFDKHQPGFLSNDISNTKELFAKHPSDASQENAYQAKASDIATSDAVQKINDIFNSDSRRQNVQDYGNAVQQRGMTDLDRTFDDNARNLKFAMARSGLTSGSADVDLNDRLNDDYARGVLQVIANAKKAESDLRAADEASRARLISQAQAGYGLTNGAQDALSAMQSNLAQAQSQIAPQTFDQLFSQWANVYDQSQIAKGQREAEMAGLGTLFNNFNQSPGY